MSNAIIKDRSHKYCVEVLDTGIGPCITICLAARSDVLTHFRYLGNDNYGGLDYRPAMFHGTFQALN